MIDKIDDLMSPPGPNFISESLIGKIVLPYLEGYGITENNFIFHPITFRGMIQRNKKGYGGRDTVLTSLMTSRLYNLRFNMKKTYYFLRKIRNNNGDTRWLPDENLFYQCAMRVNKLVALWNEKKVIKAENYTVRHRGIYTKLVKYDNFIEDKHKEISGFLMAQHENLIESSSFGDRFSVMNLDIRLPMIEQRRLLEHIFAFHPDSIREVNSEKILLKRFNELMRESYTLLEKVPNKEDRVFKDLSSELQNIYDRWISPRVFFSVKRDQREDRGDMIEEIAIIIDFVKTETKKYIEYMQEADIEKGKILSEVNKEKEKELEAEIEIKDVEISLKKEDKLINKLSDEDLEKKLLQIDKQFFEAQEYIKKRNKEEIESLIREHGNPEIRTKEITPKNNKNKREFSYKKNTLEEIIGRRF